MALNNRDILKEITSRREKKLFLLLIVLCLVYSMIEVVGIAAIMPYIALVSNPQLVTENSYYQFAYNLTGYTDTIDFIVLFGVLLIGFYIFRAGYSLIYTYAINRFSFDLYHIFARRLLEKYVELPYNEFADRNSSIMIKTIITETQNVAQYIQQFLMLFAEMVTIIFIYALLLYVNYEMTLVLTFVLGIKVIFLTKTVSKKIKSKGSKRLEILNEMYVYLGKTFGNFKFMKLKCAEDKMLDEFSAACGNFSKINVSNGVLQVIPRTATELIGFGSLVIIILYVLIKAEDTTHIILIISMYALALFRIFPALNRVMRNYNSMQFQSKALSLIYEDLSFSCATDEYAFNNAIDFKETIELRNVFFSYDNRKNILSDISLTIYKGDKIAFVGPSGSGKSTLVDLIIGLYRPDKGDLYIDGVNVDYTNLRSWRKKIGYIPQSVYLFDGTVAENVAFGEKLDEQKVVEVLKKANIYSYFQDQIDGIYAKVGEGGIKLSGGQKQRIGIARALYSSPEILVLDEATSALDVEIENIIMEEIYNICENKTLIVIAHRLSTIEKCERVIDMKNISAIK